MKWMEEEFTLQMIKITAVKNSPKPQSVDNIRSFLGLAGHYQPLIHSVLLLKLRHS